ncbi:nucleic acid/nucleotide deaminase domain-containing protein [Phaeacidiphilus oryzae]|uniref:nucleic acid/nucleotide deaminase domain-containing protein n=1 Tax=Phaeacidiphilus oryzae TaxID=348818 RepID=UPI0013774A96|nr:nucleic acid/nucleotide deaminase domain-containing protein [Phaeacidiphilus oryzae]
MSTQQVEKALLARFGEAGLQRFPYAPGGELSTRIGLPREVDPYFEAEEDAQSPDEQHPLVLGHDPAAPIQLAGDGSVVLDYGRISLPPRAVNAALPAFAAGLVALDEALPRIREAFQQHGQDAAFDEYRLLRDQLTADDPSAFAERENWWPLVLDDIRHQLLAPFSAAVEYIDRETGEKRILTAQTAPGLPHPEEMLADQLIEAGVSGQDVVRVYSELEPCLMPGHYCALWMANGFPNAEFTHRFDYGTTAESREEGVKELIQYLVDQAESESRR